MGENQTSLVKKFSTFLCVENAKIQLIEITPLISILTRASSLFFPILKLLRVLSLGEGLQWLLA